WLSVGASATESCVLCFFFSSRRRHTRFSRDWSSDVCSSDLRSSPRPRRSHLGPYPACADHNVACGGVHRPATACADVRTASASRSEERRVGKECRSRWSPHPKKQKQGRRGGRRRIAQCTRAV